MQLFPHWQGHNSSCQCSPTGPSPCLLVMESGGNSPLPQHTHTLTHTHTHTYTHNSFRDVAARWPSGKCSPLWMTAAWESEGSSTGSMSLNATRMSHRPSLTHTLHLFSPNLSLCHVSLFRCLTFNPLLVFSLLPSLSFTIQGSEKGWSDNCRPAEEDREQPQSPRFPHQEWPSTCLKNETVFLSVLTDCGW